MKRTVLCLLFLPACLALGRRPRPVGAVLSRDRHKLAVSMCPLTHIPRIKSLMRRAPFLREFPLRPHQRVPSARADRYEAKRVLKHTRKEGRQLASASQRMTALAGSGRL